MIKKYFAMSIIAASVAMTACSDDDDDNPAPTPGTGTETPGEMPTGPVAPPATPGEGNTALDFVVNSPDHAELTRLVTAAGLADTLDDPAAQYTIFAPTDAAFAALPEGALAELEADTAALARVLKHHVLEGSVQSGEIQAGVSVTPAVEGEETPVEGEETPVEGEETPAVDAATPFTVATLASGAPAQSLTFSANTEGTGYDITDGSGNVVPLVGPLDQNLSTEVDAPTTGIVHVIENVLMPVAADPVTETPVEGEETPVEGEETPVEGEEPGGPVVGGDSTGVKASLEGLGNYTGFAGISEGLFEAYDANAWTVFAPTDEALAAAAGVTPDVQNHIAVNAGALTPEQLLAAGTIATNNGNEYPVAGTADAVTVGGFPVSVVATGAGGAQIYSIEGVLE